MNRRVTINDISKALGVTPTTVTKALNGKPQVSDEMRKLVIETARKMNYVPNRSAQALVRNELLIYLIYGKEPEEFVKYIEYGFKDAFDMLADYRIRGVFSPFKELNSTEELKSILAETAGKKVDAVILTPILRLNEYIHELNLLVDKGIPVLSLFSRLNEVDSIGTIRLNSLITGKMAAHFLSILRLRSRSVAIFAGNKDAPVHAECIDGFIAEANQRGLDVKGVFETHENKDIAYYLTKKVIHDIPDLGGIYVSSYNSVGVCNCIEELGMQDDIQVIGQDIYPELVKKLNNESLRATLFQDQYNQAKTSVLKLSDYLMGNIDTIGEILITPTLVLKSNLENYLQHYNKEI